ncbi:MAG: DUF3368 domain-containing protein [Sulfuricella sp.]|nr:DUF3368 domain-containing protein [Sulfuricella sp.]
MLALPKKAFGRAVMPETVFAECLAQAIQPDALAIRRAVDDGMLVVEADCAWPADVPEPRLDEGERAALGLAVKLCAPVLMDELRGRRVARKMGIPLMGVCGLLLLSKREGWIPAVAPLLAALREKGYFISPELQAGVLRAADEA